MQWSLLPEQTLLIRVSLSHPTSRLLVVEWSEWDTQEQSTSLLKDGQHFFVIILERGLSCSISGRIYGQAGGLSTTTTH